MRVLCILLILFANFQTALPKTRLTLAFSQSAADDWKQGESQTLELCTKINSEYEFSIDTLRVQLSAKYALGAILEKNENDRPAITRPTDNSIFAEAVAKYPLGWSVDPYVSASVKTQITESFRVFKSERKRTAKLWDPVTSQQSLGFAYGIRKNPDRLTFRMGISLKQIRAKEYTAMTDDRKTRDIKEGYKAESGIDITANGNTMLDSSITYRGKLRMFGTFDNLKVWTINYENEFEFTIWKALKIILNMDLIYNDKQTAGIQYRQSIRLGLVSNI
jgi:hypothetical protein